MRLFFGIQLGVWEYGARKMRRYFRVVDVHYDGLAYYGTWRYRFISYVRLPIARGW